MTTVQDYLQSSTQQMHKPLTFESSNKYEQSHQQDFGIYQKYELTNVKFDLLSQKEPLLGMILQTFQ